MQSCTNTYQSFHLVPGFLFILIYNTTLCIVISKEQWNHFVSIYKSNSLSLPLNVDYQNEDENENEAIDIDMRNEIDINHNEYQQPELAQSAHNYNVQQLAVRDTKYNFFGTATFETYFDGISNVLTQS